MKRILALAGLALLACVALLVGRALLLRPQRSTVTPVARTAFLDEAAIVERLAAAIRIETVSHQDPAEDDPAAFQAFREHLERSYPALHASLRREIFNERSLLYTWPGRDASLPGVVLMAHQDVVPVEPGTESNWDHPAFSGAIADGFVWGRGTLDTKGKLTAICEAIEVLAREGFQPKRTTYLFFGHDEEVGGRNGARAIVQRFESEGKHFEWVLDEGGTIAIGIVPGVTRPAALIGIAEKGYLTLALTATAEGGHSSMPPPNTAIGILAAGIVRLEAQPLPAAVRGATHQFLSAIAPEMDLPTRTVVANADLLEPLLLRALSGSPRSNATIRTTTAVTMIQAGIKENALPATARAIANFRLLPGDTIDGVIEHVRRAVADPRITVAVLEGSHALEPSPESRTDSEAFALLTRTIQEMHPDAVIAPNLVLGGTDARYFRAVSENVYRFGPLRLGAEDLKRPHGTNERIDAKDYVDSIHFYVRLLRNAG